MNNTRDLTGALVHHLTGRDRAGFDEKAGLWRERSVTFGLVIGGSIDEDLLERDVQEGRQIEREVALPASESKSRRMGDAATDLST